MLGLACSFITKASAPDQTDQEVPEPPVSPVEQESVSVSPTVAVSPTPRPTAVLEADLEFPASGNFYFPLPPVVEVPGFAVVFTDARWKYPASFDAVSKFVAFEWDYEDQNEWDYEYRLEQIREALKDSGWVSCDEQLPVIDINYDFPQEVDTFFSCNRGSEWLTWGITFYFSANPPEPLPYPIASYIPNLFNLDSASYRDADELVRYSFFSSTVGFGAGAPIPPVSLPMSHLQFWVFRGGPDVDTTQVYPRFSWRFRDDGSLSHGERLATANRLLKEGGWKGCEEEEQEWKFEDGYFSVTTVITCRRGLERLWWNISYLWEGDRRGSYDQTERETQSVFSTVALETGPEDAPPTYKAVSSQIAQDCRVGELPADFDQALRRLRDLLTRAGAEFPADFDPYDSWAWDTAVAVSDAESCVVTVLLRNTEYGTVIYETSDGEVRMILTDFSDFLSW
ncbi:MAG: hypothetical protein BMS9Abin34_525 [Patescibacteria group bacterium]|nr:MAG: hypothetical protein BMS9Abin34_525 [Patescibacteria group bacterium]